MIRGMCLFLVAVGSFLTVPLLAQDVVLTEDSKPHEGVPEGKVLGPFSWKSAIFPGTVRNYWLYVPQQYTPEKKACVFVLQDGLGVAKGWRVPQVLDNLIHKQEVPVQIGIFIEPGVVPAANENAQPRFNRSFEYDAVGDRYAKFLIEEILPEVKKQYNLSDDPNDRAIAGSSSGAICAFNVAWERPDQFRRVFSAIGTYVGLRGADQFPTLIRKTEPKPLRVFLQDGSHDLNIYGGDWFIANQDMLSALTYANYQVDHVWGDGGHNGKHASQILPDGLRFLWKNYPEPVPVPAPQQARADLLIPGEGWKEVSSGHKYTEGPVVNASGELFFSDGPANQVHKIDLQGKVSVFAKDCPRINGLAFGPDGKLYGCENGSKQIVRFSPDGQKETVLSGVTCNDIVVLANGTGYFTDPENQQIYFFTTDGEKKVVDTGIERPNGLVTSPDQTLLTVADSFGRMTYSFQIQPDGTLAAKQPYGWLHMPDDATRAGADGLTVDTEGRVYVASRMGVQVLDQPGRVNLILSRPPNNKLSNLVFGGPDLNHLYATAGNKVYVRHLKAQGVRLYQAPIKPPKPRL